MNTDKKNRYYTSVINYGYISLLRDNILNLDKSNNELIIYIKQHDIYVNCYVSDRAMWVPLIFMCMRFKERQDLVKHLLKSGANVKLKPDGFDNILVACHSCYLPYLANIGCDIPKEHIKDYIMRQLIGGAVCRLQQLIKLNILQILHIKLFITDHPNIIMELTETMVKYLFYAFNIKTNVENKKDELDKTLTKVKSSLRFIISHGAVIDAQYIVYCASHYLYEFLEEVKEDIKYDIEVPYHPYMSGDVVSTLRPLLNDYRYVKTCEILKVTPNDEVYQPVNNM